MTRLVALLVCAAPAVFASTAAGSLRGGAQVIIVFAADCAFYVFWGAFCFAGSFLPRVNGTLSGIMVSLHVEIHRASCMARPRSH